MIDGYSGDTINYVCDDYRNNQQTCHQIKDYKSSDSNNSTNEETPKTFFTLMAKIYLS
jgi:hypothetical protein